MDDDATTYSGLMHAGAGTGLLLVQLSAIVPGLLLVKRARARH